MKIYFKLLQERKKTRIYDKEVSHPKDVIAVNTEANNICVPKYANINQCEGRKIQQLNKGTLISHFEQ